MDSSYSPYRFNLVDGWGIWWGLPQPTLRGSSLSLRLSPSCASAAASLAWSCPRYAISDGGFGRHGGKTAWGKIIAFLRWEYDISGACGFAPITCQSMPLLVGGICVGVCFKWKSLDNKFIKIFTSAVKKTSILAIFAINFWLFTYLYSSLWKKYTYF